MAEFLLELLSEEIPARMQARAAADLERLVTGALRDAGLPWQSARFFATPRRLTVVVDGLPLAQPDVSEERKGPRADAPEQAIAGFLRATGLSLDQCEKRPTAKGEIWFAVIEKAGRPTSEVLRDVIGEAVTKLPWPKSMRWGESGFRWVRPLQHVLAVFDGAPLAGDVEPDPRTRLVFTAETRGHRFLAPGAVPVEHFEGYRSGLRDAHVMLDAGDRKDAILEQARTLVAAEGLRLRDDPGLLDEVAGLVEWPVVHMGRIDDAFMDLPAEVLTTSMRSHQRYFAVEGSDGTLAPRFLFAANTVTDDGGAIVVAGNERVLRARLSDARFFWDKDRAVRLADRVAALGDIVFHDRLGTVAGKVNRLEQLSAALAVAAGADPDLARRAAHLAKADLTTGMVGEFPELQGVMGRYYAGHDGEPADVANAVAEHYAPLGPSDRCPTAPVSVSVALADKIDSLVGFFAIDERPTGSRDPYALRRAALGAIRLIVENGLRLRLLDAIGESYRQYRRSGSWRGDVADGTALSGDLLAFFADRLKVALKERGVRHDLIQAVFDLGGQDDLVLMLARVDALAEFLAGDDGANLLIAYRRAANIVRIEEKKDGRKAHATADPGLLEQAEERALYAALKNAEESMDGLLPAEDFTTAMTALAALRQPVDSFFDAVTVNADKPGLRANRLALLGRIVATMDRVAVFSRIEG
ncbi:MAG: glycine--tRNA ligase subunit beta [Inquilinaceae bacterium]